MRRGPFVTKELVDVVLAAAKLSDAAVCGAPCSDSLKEVGEDGLVRPDHRPLEALDRADAADFPHHSCCATPTRRR